MTSCPFPAALARGSFALCASGLLVVGAALVAAPPDPAWTPHRHRPDQNYYQDYPPFNSERHLLLYRSNAVQVPPAGWRPDVIQVPHFRHPGQPIYKYPDRADDVTGFRGDDIHRVFGEIAAVWTPSYYDQKPPETGCRIDSYYYSFDARPEASNRAFSRSLADLEISPGTVRPPIGWGRLPDGDTKRILLDPRRGKLWFEALENRQIIPLFECLYEYRDCVLYRVPPEELPDGVTHPVQPVVVPHNGWAQLFVASAQRGPLPGFRNLDLTFSQSFETGEVKLHTIETGGDEIAAELIVAPGLHTAVPPYYQRLRVGDWLQVDEYAYQLTRIVPTTRLRDGREIVGWIEFNPECRITTLADYHPPTDPSSYVHGKLPAPPRPFRRVTPPPVPTSFGKGPGPIPPLREMMFWSTILSAVLVAGGALLWWLRQPWSRP